MNLPSKSVPPSPSSDSCPLVTCILLNWNGWEDTVACLRALVECTYPRLNVVVVDNASTDGSPARIKADFPDILLLESGTNLGFAGGNNIGIRYALAHDADYVWLLNNDTQPSPDALSALVNKALTDPHIGAVGSVCYYADAPTKVQAWAGGRVKLWIGHAGPTSRPHPDDWFQYLNGASLLISRKALEDAGLLDEGFFLYMEDTEFSLRLRKKGWRIAAAPDSGVLHKVNASTGGNLLIIDRHLTASVLRMLRLHAPMPLLATSLFLAVRLGRRLLGLQFARCHSVLLGIDDYRRMSPVTPRIR